MRQGDFIGPTIIAISIVIAAVAFALVDGLLKAADVEAQLRLNRAETEIDELRDDLRAVERELREAEARAEQLSESLALVRSEAAGRAPVTAPPDPADPADPAVPVPDTPKLDEIEEHRKTEAPTEVMRLARDRFNVGITQPRSSVMLDLLGNPRVNYGQDCRGMTNPRLLAALETRQVGPIRVQMLRPALDSLERIFAELKRTEPDLHDQIGTAGTLCVRFIRGSKRAISNHSWGTAIDLTIADQLDGFGDGGTQFGLVLLASLFNEEGWYWGATYSREDSMHFEVGVETLSKWLADGAL